MDGKLYLLEFTTGLSIVWPFEHCLCVPTYLLACLVIVLGTDIFYNS